MNGLLQTTKHCHDPALGFMWKRRKLTGLYFSSKTFGRSLQNICLKVKKTMFTNNDIKDTDKNTTLLVLEYLGLGKRTSTKMNLGSYWFSARLTFSMYC